MTIRHFGRDLAAAGLAALLLAGAGGAGAAVAPAATPAPAPASAPADKPPAAAADKPPTAPAPTTGLALDVARKAAAGAEAEARRLNLPATIVVVDASGDIVLAQKMDNAPFGGFEPARRKARGAALARRGAGGQAVAPVVLPANATASGGELITVGTRVVGAIGVSAGKLQEEQVAKAGAAAVK